MCRMILRLLILLLLNIFPVNAENLKDCEWSEKSRVPCITIAKTNNTSNISEVGVNKTIITKQEIEEHFEYHWQYDRVSILLQKKEYFDSIPYSL